MSLLKCEKLKLGYDGRVIAENISFEVNSGDYLCIVGENGSGKTTLMRAILGLKDPIEGTMSFEKGLSKSEIGYLPQQTVTQKDFPASVYEVVISGCLNKPKSDISTASGASASDNSPDKKTKNIYSFFKKIANSFRVHYSKEDKESVKKNLMLLGIPHLSKKCYRELSGGQQQRVLLARALCASTKLIVLDEPVSGLDPKVTQEMYGLIKSLNHSGVTVIMVSHDISAAIKYASHILHISNEPLFFGTKDEYLKTEICKTFSVK